jgi:hypothetical protein
VNRSLLRSGPRAWLAVASSILWALLLGSCTIPIGKVERDPVDSAPGEPKVLRDLGLSCSQCQFSWGSGCSLIEERGSALVAVATGAKVADELQECLQPASADGVQPCVIHRAYRFDDLQFVRRSTDFKSTDAFAGSERVDARNRRQGLRLKPDARYVIVAAHPDAATSPRASWAITAACEVPATATFPVR